MAEDKWKFPKGTRVKLRDGNQTFIGVVDRIFKNQHLPEYWYAIKIEKSDGSWVKMCVEDELTEAEDGKAQSSHNT